jgi:hypothetical protein
MKRHRSTHLSVGFSPTGLAKHVIREATGESRDAIAGAEVWRWEGQTLRNLAAAHEMTNNPDHNLLPAVEVANDSGTDF